MKAKSLVATKPRCIKTKIKAAMAAAFCLFCWQILLKSKIQITAGMRGRWTHYQVKTGSIFNPNTTAIKKYSWDQYSLNLCYLTHQHLIWGFTALQLCSIYIQHLKEFLQNKPLISSMMSLSLTYKMALQPVLYFSPHVRYRSCTSCEEKLCLRLK